MARGAREAGGPGELTRPLRARPFLTGHLLLAMALRRGDAEGAEAVADKLPDLLDEETLALADLLVDQGEQGRAVQWLARQFQQWPCHDEVFERLLGMAPRLALETVEGLGETEAARPFLAQALLDGSYEPEFLYEYWRIDPAGLEENLQRFESDPKGSCTGPYPLRRTLNETLVERGHGQATPTLLEADEPRDPSDWRGLAQDRLEAGDEEGAQVAWARFLEQDERIWFDPELDGPLLELLPGPRLAFARSQAAKGGDWDEVGNAGEMLFHLGRWDEADRAFQRARDLEPGGSYWGEVVARRALGLPPFDDSSAWDSDDLLDSPFGILGAAR